MALNPKDDLLTMIEHESFQNVTKAIRAAVVYPYLDRLRRRQHRRQGGELEEPGFDPEHDLVTDLITSADRGSDEFLRGLFKFAAYYNEQTMRRNERVQPQRRRPMTRTEDLKHVAAWVKADRHGLVSTALLAYGTSLLPKREEDADIEGVDESLDGEEYPE